MNINELKDKTPDQLDAILVDMKKEALNLRFQQTSGELTAPARIRIVRRSIARIHTLKTQSKNGVVQNTTKEPKVAKASKVEKTAKKAVSTKAAKVKKEKANA